MPSLPAALDLLLRADAEPWDWTVPTLPVLAARIGGAPPIPEGDAHVIGLPDSSVLRVEVDRDGLPSRLAVPLAADTPLGGLTAQVATRLGPYVTVRRGEKVIRWWMLPSGRHLQGVFTPTGEPGTFPLWLELVRTGIPPQESVPPDALAEAAADLAVRIAEAGYVPVEDESLPDMAAALGGRLSWAGSASPHRHIVLPQAPYLLELVSPITSDTGLTWYPELRLELYGAGDVAGLSRQVPYDLAIGAVSRRYGAPTRPGPEACFWTRETGWTVAVDRSTGVVAVRVRPPDEAPVRPPE